jgi:epoxyqueuosine reductase
MDRYDAWLASGCAAGMDYLCRHRDLRADPRRILPNARSVIVVAARYPVHPQPGRGFSALAWDADYHDVVRSGLNRLRQRLEPALALGATRICVDSAPLAEREWALRAGIGWRGRQGQVVNETAGCCLVLGFLLTEAALAVTTPVAGRCGACTRCRDACPTGAVRKDGTVDARRCVAYWTVEHRGDIPPHRAGALGESLHGCDRCTAVCPWNRFGGDRLMPGLSPDQPLPDAGECLRMDEASFAARFAGTVVKRLGLTRLQRNAAIVLANRGRSDTVAAGGTPHEPADPALP